MGINYFGFGSVVGGSCGCCCGVFPGVAGVVPGNFGISGGGGTGVGSATVGIVTESCAGLGG